MDIAYTSGNDKFNYRVCAMIISDGEILAMHDDRSPYFYLPGGRVMHGETGEDVALDDTWNYIDILWNGIQAEKVQRAFEKLPKETMIAFE